jgi:hypothetical protein
MYKDRRSNETNNTRPRIEPDNPFQAYFTFLSFRSFWNISFYLFFFHFINHLLQGVLEPSIHLMWFAIFCMSTFNSWRLLSQAACPDKDQEDEQTDWNNGSNEKGEYAQDLSTLLWKQEVHGHAIVMIVSVYWCKETGWSQTHQYGIYEICGVLIKILIFFKC